MQSGFPEEKGDEHGDGDEERREEVSVGPSVRCTTWQRGKSQRCALENDLRYVLVRPRMNNSNDPVIKNTPTRSNLCNLENWLSATRFPIFQGNSRAPTPAEAKARMAMNRNSHFQEASSKRPPLDGAG